MHVGSGLHIVMTNGNTGVSDVIIGNHHCRLLWDRWRSYCSDSRATVAALHQTSTLD